VAFPVVGALAAGLVPSFGAKWSGTATSRELVSRRFPTARLYEPLAEVPARFDTLAAERLPVVENCRWPRLVGTLSRRYIPAAYSVRLTDVERTPSLDSPPP
jgi:hypothetical protein